MSDCDSKAEEYQRMQFGYLPVLNLKISLTPYELGDPDQALHIELLRTGPLRRLAIKFSGVVDLRMDRLHPGNTCLLQIVSVADAQLENVRYHVFNGEQDLTLIFDCWDFTFEELDL